MSRVMTMALCALLFGAVFSACGPSNAGPPLPAIHTPAVTFVTLSSNSGPMGIVTGPDGAVWYTEFDADGIGRLASNGTISHFGLAPAPVGPNSLSVGSDGALWFTELDANRIGRITTSGTISEYPLPQPSSQPLGITSGPDGALWFTQQWTQDVGRITTTGAISEFPLNAGSNAGAITSGPDGALWFCEVGSNNIGRMTTAGALTEYAIPTARSFPSSIVAGPDGALWFTELWGAKIGRITTSGSVTETPLPSGVTQPEALTVARGDLWFLYQGGIGRLVPGGAVTAYSDSGIDTNSTESMTVGPDGALWFAQRVHNEIGRFDITQLH